jgi:hypothetical protein
MEAAHGQLKLLISKLGSKGKNKEGAGAPLSLSKLHTNDKKTSQEVPSLEGFTTSQWSRLGD